MNMDQRTKILHRIMSDYVIILINNKKYIIRRPTPDVLYHAQLEYEKTISNNKFNEWLSENECINHLIKIGKWTVDGDQKIEQIDKFVEDQKVALYNSVNSANTGNSTAIRKQLWQAKDLLKRLYEVKNSLFSFTLPGFAHSVKQNYILSQTVYYNDKLVSDISSSLLDKIKIKMCEYMIDSEEFREIARTDPWRSYWGVSNNPFNRSSIELDYDKRTLLAYSRMYDNIYEHPECPNDDIVNDDDMLDGWMIIQQREKTEKKKEKHSDNVVQNLSSKYQNATEIFLPAQAPEQVEDINSMNTTKANMVKKQRQNLINQQGQVGTGKLPDEVFQRNAQAREQFKNR